jgi:hypothetical protein
MSSMCTTKQVTTKSVRPVAALAPSGRSDFALFAVVAAPVESGPSAMPCFEFGYAPMPMSSQDLSAFAAHANADKRNAVTCLGHKRTIWAPRPLGRSAAPPGSEKSE